MAELNDSFKGHGSMSAFVDEVTRLFAAINSAEVILPRSATGKVPTIRIEGSKLVLDLSEVEFN